MLLLLLLLLLVLMMMMLTVMVMLLLLVVEVALVMAFLVSLLFSLGHVIYPHLSSWILCKVSPAQLGLFFAELDTTLSPEVPGVRVHCVFTISLCSVFICDFYFNHSLLYLYFKLFQSFSAYFRFLSTSPTELSLKHGTTQDLCWVSCAFYFLQVVHIEGVLPRCKAFGGFQTDLAFYAHYIA